MRCKLENVILCQLYLLLPLFSRRPEPEKPCGGRMTSRKARRGSSRPFGQVLAISKDGTGAATMRKTCSAMESPWHWQVGSGAAGSKRCTIISEL